MATILSFSRDARTPSDSPVAPSGGHLVAMGHIDLETVVETVRVLRSLGKDSLLDEFNGCRHAAAEQAPPALPATAS